MYVNCTATATTSVSVNVCVSCSVHCYYMPASLPACLPACLPWLVILYTLLVGPCSFARPQEVNGHPRAVALFRKAIISTYGITAQVFDRQIRTQFVSYEGTCTWPVQTARVCAFVRACVRSCVRVCVRACVCAFVRACARACVCVHAKCKHEKRVSLSHSRSLAASSYHDVGCDVVLLGLVFFAVASDHACMCCTC